MRFSVSDTAEYGDYVSGPRVIDDHVRATMKEILAGLGRTVRRWIAENEAGQPEFQKMRTADHNHPIEIVARAPLEDALARSDRGEVRAGPGFGDPHRREALMSSEAGVPGVAGRIEAGRVRIFDTTLRDGEQSSGAVSPSVRSSRSTRALIKLNVDIIEAGFPASSPGDFDAVNRIAKEAKGVAVAGLARCKNGDPQRAVEAIRVAEKTHLHVFVATSDIHLKHKLRVSHDEALALPPSSGSP